jgi:hypothetical protein
MMMIELVLVYCLISDSHTCIEKRPAFEVEMTPQSCLMDAERYAIDYVEAHPEWRLAGWRCEIDVPRQDPA